MTQSDKALIEKECRLIKDFKVEHAVWYYRGRKEKVGEESKVNFTEQEVSKLKNKILIHNHPSNWIKDGFCSLDVLSADDINFATDNQLKGIVSIAWNNVICVFFPKNTTFVTDDVYKKMSLSATSVFKKTNNKVKAFNKARTVYRRELIKWCKDNELELNIWRLK